MCVAVVLQPTDVVGFAIAPPNIAFIKYFGKANYALNLPSNGSYSVNFHTATHRTATLVVVSPAGPTDGSADVFYLNGVREPKLGSRFVKVLQLIREHSKV
jgi:mevalonate pyrophosphate decarboxylase